MEDNRLVEFYSKNLEKLDKEWKMECFDGKRSIKESGDLYFNYSAFWRYVTKRFNESK